MLSGTCRRARHSFSRVKHWPPEASSKDIKVRKRMLEKRLRESMSIFNSVRDETGEFLLSESMHTSSKKKGNNSKRHRKLDHVLEEVEEDGVEEDDSSAIGRT